MNASTLRTDVLFALASVGVTAVAGGVAAAPHLMHQSLSPQEQTALVGERQREAEGLASDLSGMNARVAAMRAEYAHSVQLQPPSAANSRLRELAEAAERNGVTIAKITSMDPNMGDARATVIPIRVVGTATYTHATALVRELQAHFPDTGVTAFKILGVPTTGAAPPEAQFSLDLAWFAAPANSAGGPGSPGRRDGGGGGSAPGKTR